MRITGLMEPVFTSREGEDGMTVMPMGPFSSVVKKHGAVGHIASVDEKTKTYKVRFLCPEYFDESGDRTRGGFINVLIELVDRCVKAL